ncbi:hypothetical protein [Ralstonia pseudosolanacearum]|nr:hypothetical protein [Ralstonia pseudosolanacearum]
MPASIIVSMNRAAVAFEVSSNAEPANAVVLLKRSRRLWRTPLIR